MTLDVTKQERAGCRKVTKFSAVSSQSATVIMTLKDRQHYHSTGRVCKRHRAATLNLPQSITVNSRSIFRFQVLPVITAVVASLQNITAL